MAESTLGRQRCSLGNCFFDTCHLQAHPELSPSRCRPLAVSRLISASFGGRLPDFAGKSSTVLTLD